MPNSRASSSATRDSSVPSVYSVAILVTTSFVFLQSVSAGEFLTSVVPQGAREVWKTIHGLSAYPIMVAALLAAVLIIRSSRKTRGLMWPTVVLAGATIAQWLTGHAISTLGWNWVIPIHVVLAFVVYGLAIYLSTRVVTARYSRAMAGDPGAL